MLLIFDSNHNSRFLLLLRVLINPNLSDPTTIDREKQELSIVLCSDRLKSSSVKIVKSKLLFLDPALVRIWAKFVRVGRALMAQTKPIKLKFIIYWA